MVLPSHFHVYLTIWPLDWLQPLKWVHLALPLPKGSSFSAPRRLPQGLLLGSLLFPYGGVAVPAAAGKAVATEAAYKAATSLAAMTALQAKPAEMDRRMVSYDTYDRGF